MLCNEIIPMILLLQGLLTQLCSYTVMFFRFLDHTYFCLRLYHNGDSLGNFPMDACFAYDLKSNHNNDKHEPLFHNASFYEK